MDIGIPVCIGAIVQMTEPWMLVNPARPVTLEGMGQ